MFSSELRISSEFADHLKSLNLTKDVYQCLNACLMEWVKIGKSGKIENGLTKKQRAFLFLTQQLDNIFWINSTASQSNDLLYKKSFFEFMANRQFQYTGQMLSYASVLRDVLNFLIEEKKDDFFVSELNYLELKPLKAQSKEKIIKFSKCDIFYLLNSVLNNTVNPGELAQCFHALSYLHVYIEAPENTKALVNVFLEKRMDLCDFSYVRKISSMESDLINFFNEVLGRIGQFTRIEHAEAFKKMVRGELADADRRQLAIAIGWLFASLDKAYKTTLLSAINKHVNNLEKDKIVYVWVKLDHPLPDHTTFCCVPTYRDSDCSEFKKQVEALLPIQFSEDEFELPWNYGKHSIGFIQTLALRGKVNFDPASLEWDQLSFTSKEHFRTFAVENGYVVYEDACQSDFYLRTAWEQHKIQFLKFNAQYQRILFDMFSLMFTCTMNKERLTGKQAKAKVLELISGYFDELEFSHADHSVHECFILALKNDFETWVSEQGIFYFMQYRVDVFTGRLEFYSPDDCTTVRDIKKLFDATINRQKKGEHFTVKSYKENALPPMIEYLDEVEDGHIPVSMVPKKMTVDLSASSFSSSSSSFTSNPPPAKTNGSQPVVSSSSVFSQSSSSASSSTENSLLRAITQYQSEKIIDKPNFSELSDLEKEYVNMYCTNVYPVGANELNAFWSKSTQKLRETLLADARKYEITHKLILDRLMEIAGSNPPYGDRGKKDMVKSMFGFSFKPSHLNTFLNQFQLDWTSMYLMHCKLMTLSGDSRAAIKAPQTPLAFMRARLGKDGNNKGYSSKHFTTYHLTDTEFENYMKSVEPKIGFGKGKKL